jgi:molybdenum cofactor cytidylyltransferase
VSSSGSRVALILAAGESKRFHGNKLLYKHWSKPLIVQNVENALQSGVVDSVVVVTGHGREEVERVLAESNLPVAIVFNEQYRLGMSFSIKKGVEYVLQRFSNVEALYINPGDCAWIHPAIYLLLMVKAQDYRGARLIAIPTYRGRRGHPILVLGDLISDLLNISEETRGLKGFIEKHSDKVLLVETNYPGVLLDVDEVRDLLRVKEMLHV